MKTVHLEIRGMTCDHCAQTVETAIRSVQGADSAAVDYAAGRGQVRLADDVGHEQVLRAIAAAGYGGRVIDPGERAPETAVPGPASTNGGADYDLLVIGTGAAGMAAAIRGAELGRRVGIVEAGAVGGTCVNVGCIPSKNLLAAAERFHGARVGFPGIGACDPGLDWPGLRNQKRELVNTLRGSKYLDVLASYPEITLLRGHARVKERGAIEVDGVTLRARKLVVATGTSPWTPPIPGIAAVEVLTSTTVMEIEELPESMIVLGGSAIGLELGLLFARLGTTVTIIELLPRLLPAEDEDASEELRRQLEDEGLEIVTDARVMRIDMNGGSVVARVETKEGERTFHAQRLLSATGRRADTRGLGVEAAGVEFDERGFIRVDPGMRTSNPDIFAAGDVTGGPGFVYVAAAGGRVAADNAVGDGGRILDLRAVPRVTFTSPQVAAVGLNPAEARGQGLEIDVSRLGMEHVPRALVEHQARGWIQVVAEKGSGRVLGVQAIGANAAELLGEATLAVRLRLTIDDMADTLHPYLTWVEGLKLAAQSFRTDVSKLSCCA